MTVARQQRLVTSHLRLVAKIANGLPRLRACHRRSHLEGNVGLMQAVKRFEPEKASASPRTPCGGFAPRFRNTSCARGAS